MQTANLVVTTKRSKFWFRIVVWSITLARLAMRRTFKMRIGKGPWQRIPLDIEFSANDAGIEEGVAKYIEELRSLL